MMRYFTLLAFVALLISACGTDSQEITPDENLDMTASLAIFGDRLSFDSPLNYDQQDIPSYITKDNTAANPIENKTATLGRVLFYDKSLSVDQTVSCASCHQQAKAFSDDQIVSLGINGLTGRHSMRLINTRFADEDRFFWDERAASLEEQTTMPIQDHAEMGFSGEDGDPAFEELIQRLEDLDYYQELFTWAYGDVTITEERIQASLAQFIRSIQSFDSKYDQGRAQVNRYNQDFPNFSELENEGKRIFMTPPPQGGAGCDGCHRSPEFDIDPDSRSNGVTTVAGDNTRMDNTNTRAPSLRDLFNNNGILNGPLMHDGSFVTLEEVIAHYSNVPQGSNIDRRLEGPDIDLDDAEIEALVAFLKTLSGTQVYTDEKWSDPFEK
jgi:cytochrome c peroxidase